MTNMKYGRWWCWSVDCCNLICDALVSSELIIMKFMMMIIVMITVLIIMMMLTMMLTTMMMMILLNGDKDDHDNKADKDGEWWWLKCWWRQLWSFWLDPTFHQNFAKIWKSWKIYTKLDNCPTLQRESVK